LGAFTFNLRFPGQYFDKETNLHYNYFRDYSPEIGRYIESDPIGTVLFRDMAFRSLGRIGLVAPELGDFLYSERPKYGSSYTYVKSNPLSYTDPLGLVENACTPQTTLSSPIVVVAGLDFCQQRRRYCITFCYELDMPGRFDNFGPFRACMRRCMNAVGCDL